MLPAARQLPAHQTPARLSRVRKEPSFLLSEIQDTVLPSYRRLLLVRNSLLCAAKASFLFTSPLNLAFLLLTIAATTSNGLLLTSGRTSPCIVRRIVSGLLGTPYTNSTAQRSITTTTLAISSARVITATQQRKPQHSCNSWIDYDYIQRLPCKPPIGSQSKSLFCSAPIVADTSTPTSCFVRVGANLQHTIVLQLHPPPQPQTPARDRPTDLFVTTT